MFLILVEQAGIREEYQQHIYLLYFCTKRERYNSLRWQLPIIARCKAQQIDPSLKLMVMKALHLRIIKHLVIKSEPSAHRNSPHPLNTRSAASIPVAVSTVAPATRMSACAVRWLAVVVPLPAFSSSAYVRPS